MVKNMEWLRLLQIEIKLVGLDLCEFKHKMRKKRIFQLKKKKSLNSQASFRIWSDTSEVTPQRYN